MRPYISQELCTNCKECVTICPYDVFSNYEDGIVVVSPEDCIECTSCVESCPNMAIFMDD